MPREAITNTEKPAVKDATTATAIGATIVGSAASAAGIVAAGTSTTGAISAAGAAIGGVAGGVLGSGVGLATGGVGMAATIPFATAGAAIGGWAGPALALVGIGTAPAWAVPVAIGGGLVAVGGAAVAAYKYFSTNDESESNSYASTSKFTGDVTVIRCSECNASLRVPAKKHMHIKCPTCDHTFEVTT
jgi:ribosomal protein S27E